MSAEIDSLRILRLHKTWAARHSLLWQLATLLLFGVAYFVLEEAGTGVAERTGAFVMLAAMILVAAVWQAVAGGVARIHMSMHGIDLETWQRGGSPSPRDRS